MQEHFDRHLNIRQFIYDWRPRLVVECGAWKGETTRLIAHLLDSNPFEFHVITDNDTQGFDPRIKIKRGLSYNMLETYEDNSIGMCIIDTDHNYWTLYKELTAVKNKMTENGLILLHDVEEFYHDTGMAMAYWDDQPYPEKEILDCSKFGGLGDALIRFLFENNNLYRLVTFTTESHGGAAIQKRTTLGINIIRPGTKPECAPKPKEEVPA